MHKMKKIVAALFVIAALLAMAIPAFAAGNGAAPAPDAAQTQQSEAAQTADSSLGLKAVARMVWACLSASSMRCWAARFMVCWAWAFSWRISSSACLSC